MRVERLPFTVYDVLGYFVPGLLLLIGILHFSPWMPSTEDRHFAFLTGSFAGQAVAVALAIAAAYTVGHIVSLLAGKTIEAIVVWIFDYPSQYLLEPSGYHQRPWQPRALPNIAKAKIVVNFKTEFGEELTAVDRREWFSMIDYFVRNRNSQAAARMYNYVVLYGFLRNSSFVFFILGFSSLAFGRLTLCPPSASLWLAVASCGLGVFAMLGFQKYYRRYSLEALMAFAIGSDGESES
jgi:hypothetical protein